MLERLGYVNHTIRREDCEALKAVIIHLTPVTIVHSTIFATHIN